MDSRKHLSRKEALAALQRTRRGEEDGFAAVAAAANDDDAIVNNYNVDDEKVKEEDNDDQESDEEDWIVHDDEIEAKRFLKRQSRDMEMRPTPSKTFFNKKKMSSPTPATSNHKESIIDDVLEEMELDDIAFSSDNEAESEQTIKPLISKESKTNKKKPDYLDFFWLDAFEHPGGTVDLFGKTKDSTSVKVTVKNIKRTLYFLPRESDTLTFKDIEEEIISLSTKYQWKDVQISCVQRRYAFEVPNIPVEADWIKVRMSFSSSFTKEEEIRADRGGGGRTFSHCFGIGTGPLELLLLKSKLMGPCWLRISPPFTLSRTMPHHYTISDRKQISHLQQEDNTQTPTPKPFLVSTCISIRTLKKEIISISLLHNRKMDLAAKEEEHHLTSTTIYQDKGHQHHQQQQQTAINDPTRISVKDEETLLQKFLFLIEKQDPDILVGHHLIGSSGSILFAIIERLRHCRCKDFHLLGRGPLKRSNTTNTAIAPSISTNNHQWIERSLTQGRLLVCTMASSKDILKLKSYSLATLCRHFGIISAAGSVSGHDTESTMIEEISDGDGSDCEDGDGDAIIDGSVDFVNIVQTTSNDILRSIEKDCRLTNALMVSLQILPLTLQLTNIAGNLWSRTLVGGRAERNEALLLHEFHSKKYILPDKATAAASPSTSSKSSQRKKAAYEGGLVLEPKRGLYETIVILLDFNSLYPSIIQEYNICFSTVIRGGGGAGLMMDEDNEPTTTSRSTGILPMVLKSLVSKRRQVKERIKGMKKDGDGDDDDVARIISQLNIEQQALKLTANSMYGCLGFTNSRFYAPEIASLITRKGRSILSGTVDIAQSLDLDVIYGDTDSVMINTATSSRADALAMANSLKEAVNVRYKLLEIEMESMFSKLLLLRKKKYAALIMGNGGAGSEEKIECKGLDLVRRDWSPISSIVSKQVLSSILRGPIDPSSSPNLATEILNILATLSKNISKEPMSSFVITKNLTKPPSQYGDPKSQPHVMVALRYNGKDGLKLEAGDPVPYVICCRPSKGLSLSECAYHPDELKAVNGSVVNTFSSYSGSVGVVGGGLVHSNNSNRHKIDLDWYLGQQVHPCINRLCEFVVGCSSAKIAKALGLDERKFGGGSGGSLSSKQERFIDETQEALLKCSTGALLAGRIEERDRWGSVDGGVLRCTTTITTCSVGFFAVKESLEGRGFLNCPSCNERPLDWEGQLCSIIKERIHSYYQFWMSCSVCSCRTRMPRMYESDLRCPMSGCAGVVSQQMSAESLYRSLLFFRNLFDPKTIKRQFSKSISAPSSSKRVGGGVGGSTLDEEAQSIIVEEMGDRFSASCENIRDLIGDLISQSSYPIVQLDLIFKKQQIPML